jgi:hypothetical protein
VLVPDGAKVGAGEGEEGMAFIASATIQLSVYCEKLGDGGN